MAEFLLKLFSIPLLHCLPRLILEFISLFTLLVLAVKWIYFHYDAMELAITVNSPYHC